MHDPWLKTGALRYSVEASGILNNSKLYEYFRDDRLKLSTGLDELRDGDQHRRSIQIQRGKECLVQLQNQEVVCSEVPYRDLSLVLKIRKKIWI